MSEKISLYFHIPFCTRKCDYCHFYVLPNKKPLHDTLIEGLLLDLKLWAAELRGKTLVSIYFGGGTPSLIGPEKLSLILCEVQKIIPFEACRIEITLEANPETISPELMSAYADVGVNRVSIGVQSLDDSHLIKLGRTHHSGTAVKAVEMTYNAGIKNISIDLMYDIPGQTLKSWEQTLTNACKLPITHLSLYNLTIEPHTVFFKYRESLLKELPDADSSTQMYEMAVSKLESAGLQQYEISAFARDGMISQHNVGYWTARPFIGFGPSAFSYWHGERFRSVANLNRYVEALKGGSSPTDFRERLDPDAAQKELLAIAIRLKQGVDLTKFPLSNDTLETVERLIGEGYIERQNQRISLTKKGILFYDTVAVELI